MQSIVFVLSLSLVSFGSCTIISYCDKPHKGPAPSHVVSPLPHTYIKQSSLPKEFDWRAQAYLAPPTNQFLPTPCGSCWAHASTGALTDRFMIASKTAIPQLSPQVLLDCGDIDGEIDTGSCYGGNKLKAYEFVYTYGITDITCSPYTGHTETNWGEKGACSQRMCRQCDVQGNCQYINGTMYHISEYGYITGELQMMAEIYARGPIACSLYAHSEQFMQYKTGIITDPTHYNITTHVVAIVGWGVDVTNATTYWIGRNSFGTAWGEGGWFKLERGKNTLNIEDRICSWAVPRL